MLIQDPKVTSPPVEPVRRPAGITSAAEYNLAHPDAPIHADDRARHHPHRFTGTGLIDDTTGSGTPCQLGFPLGGISRTPEDDRTGVVLAARRDGDPNPAAGCRWQVDRSDTADLVAVPVDQGALGQFSRFQSVRHFLSIGRPVYDCYTTEARFPVQPDEVPRAP